MLQGKSNIAVNQRRVDVVQDEDKSRVYEERETELGPGTCLGSTNDGEFDIYHSSMDRPRTESIVDDRLSES